MRIIKFFFLFLFCFPLFSIGQNAGYYVRNYAPKEYKGFNQMWQVVQDHNGYMYFAGTSSVFIFSGQFWETVPVKAGAATRQVLIGDDSVIYVSSVGDFGYIAKKEGKWKFNSFITELTTEQKSFNDVWKIHVFNDAVYFQSSERIFKVKDRKITKIIESLPDKGFALSFVSNGHLYARQRQVGLVEIINDEISLVKGGEVFADKRVLAIIPFSKKQNLVLTGDEGMFLMDLESGSNASSSFRKDPFSSDAFLKSAGVLGAKWINDSLIGINSRAGIGLYSRNGKLIEVLDKSCGLSDESIAEFMIDREENLWLVHNNGISCVAYNSPILLYDDKTGFSGRLEILHLYNDDVYLTTSDGLFKAKPTNPLHPNSLEFEQTVVVNTEVWDIYNTYNGMLLASSDGLLRFRDNKEEQITNFYTNSIAPVENSSLIATAEKNGISLIDIASLEPQIKKHYDVPGQELMEMAPVAETGESSGFYGVWATTRFKRIMFLELSMRDSLLKVREYGPENGIFHNNYCPVRFKDSVYFCTVDTCFRYCPELDKNKNSLCFINAPDVFEKLYKGEVQDLHKPHNGKLFLEKKNYLSVYGENERGNLTSSNIRVIQRFKESSLNYALLRPDGKVMLTLDNVIVLYDTNKKILNKKAFKCFIRSISLNNDSVIYSGRELPSAGPAIPFDKNHITFRFEAPFFMMDDPVMFSYNLEGYDTTWSKFTALTQKDFSNLHEGKYTFKVQAMNSFGQLSNVAEYTFVVEPPWYRTIIAYIFYFLGFLLILYFTVKISASRLRKQKDKLEAMVRERTAEVVAQKLMLETAYGEIKDSIRYAKRIQNALLASTKLLQEHLQEYFIYYKPKDIVSGDFYWAQPKGDWLYMITADCTGHGVPGAFMSLLNISFLNETLNTPGFTSPDRILGEVRSQIIEALRSDGSEEGGKDGMDCVLCTFNFKTRELLFAAANNPLWICRDKNIIEFRPDKFPVGKHDRENEPFHLHKVDLLPGDIVYTFTDGYSDQFGGISGKKFKIRQLKELLLSVAHLPMNEQKDVVSKTIRKWKKGLDQIDDILVIGVKIN